MKLSIMQPHYLPWLGYFYLIYKSKNFVFLDDVKFHYQSWQHRNYIKGANTPNLLSIPVGKSTNKLKIVDVKINNNSFREKHIKSIYQEYCKSDYFKQFFPILEKMIYFETDNLSIFNQNIIKKITEINEIRTNFFKSSEINVSGSKEEKIINICKKLNINNYISVPGSKNYINDKNFCAKKINLTFLNYDDIKYKNLQQLKNLSVIDFVFNNGFKLKKIYT